MEEEQIQGQQSSITTQEQEEITNHKPISMHVAEQETPNEAPTAEEIADAPQQQPQTPDTNEELTSQQSLTSTTQTEIDPTATIQVAAHKEDAAVTRTPTALPSMQIADLLALHIVSDPQISPDGSLIAYSMQSSDAEYNTTSSAIWLVASQSGQTSRPRKITQGDYHDSAPRWSPDGKTLAFLSDRSGATQIYLMPMDGGETQRLSSLAQGVTAYSWRPDGQVVLAHSTWKPQDDQHTTQKQSSEVTTYTHLDIAWNGLGYRQERYQQLWLIPIAEGKAIRLTSEPVDLQQSCWSPDGTEIAFCANRRPDPDLSVSMALWVLTVATGKMRRLTPEEGLTQMPAWSPDGRTIAYIYTPDQTEAGNMSPWLVAASGEEAPRPTVHDAEQLTCQTWIIDELREEWLAPPNWYPQEQALLVPVQERGQVHLYRLDLTQDSTTKITHGNGRYLSAQISKDGQLITAVRADWFTPGDIWSMDITGQQQRKLTRVNDNLLQSHQLIRPRRVSWQSFDQQEIEGWLYLPAQAIHNKVPLILVPHGGPSLAWGDSYVHEFQVLAGQGYAVLAANPRGSAGYGEAFARKVNNDWGGDDFLDLMAGLDQLIADEPIDGQRLGISGLSYGGYMTNRAITQTDRFKAAVSRNGISSLNSAMYHSDQTIWFKLVMEDEALQTQRSALTFADNIKTPLLLLHADEDLRCPFSESFQLFIRLRKRKHPVELVRYHHVSHLMDWPGVGSPQQRIDRLQRTLNWFQRYL